MFTKGQCRPDEVVLEQRVAGSDSPTHFGPTKTYAARSLLLPPFLREANAQHLKEQVNEDADALVLTAPNGGL